MKMTKKLLFVAALSALILSFIACDMSASQLFQQKTGEKLFTYSDNDQEDGLGKWTVKGTNDTEKFMRGMQFLQTKHSDMAALVEIDEPDTGVIGVAFNVSQNTSDKDAENYKTYNFCLAGLRYYTLNGSKVVQYYVSYYANISEDNFNDDNFGASEKKDAVDAECLTPYEIEVTKYTTLKSGLINSETGIMNAIIDVDEVAAKDAGASTYGEGSYLVNIYTKDAYNEKAMKFIDDKAEYLVNTKTSVVDRTVIGKTGAAQAKVGIYANVYPAKEGTPTTLNAVVKIADLTNSAIAE